MANPNPCPATQFSALRQPVNGAPKISLLRDAADCEHVIVAAIKDPKVTPLSLAALVRAFCSLVQTIQEIRGIPKPGQLRPDLDPVQLARQVKRARSRAARQVLDVTAVTPFMDEAGKPIDGATVEHKANGEPETKKESLNPGKGVATG